MIRVRPNFDGVNLDDANAVHDAILHAVMQVPYFNGGPLPVIVVLPRHRVEWAMHDMHYPADVVSDRSLLQFMLEHYKRHGLNGFTSDGEDDEEELEAEADQRLIDLLTSHPDGVMRGGWQRAPRAPISESPDLRVAIEHAVHELRNALVWPVHHAKKRGQVVLDLADVSRLYDVTDKLAAALSGYNEHA